MTIEEAIKYWERAFDKSCRNNRYQNAEKIDYEDAVWTAIAALRAQREAEKNEPLTPEELEEYRAKELPVWCEMPVLPGITAKGWGIAGSGNAVLQNFSRTQLWYQHYGRDWVAYSRRPVKEAQDED